MEMVLSTKVSELQIFDVATGFTVFDRPPYCSDLEPWGFLLFLRLNEHLTQHHYPSDGKLRQRLSNGSVNKIHCSVVIDWRNYLTVGEDV